MAKRLKQVVILCSLLGGISFLFAAKIVLKGNGISSLKLKEINPERHDAQVKESLQKREDYLVQSKANTNSAISIEEITATSNYSKIDGMAEKVWLQSTAKEKGDPESSHSTKAPEQDEWDLEQTRRRGILRKACQQHPEWNFSLETISQRPQILWPFIFNDEYKIIYCTICKVASTTWKSAFLVLMGKYEKVEEVDLGQWYQLDRSLPTLAKLKDPREIKRRLETYKKFIFVREPFSRALSGYRNKLYKRNKYYQKKVGTKIVRLFRKNPSKEALETGVGVTFDEFLRYLTRTRPQTLDIHWRPMHLMTFPCAVKYDYVGHLETAHWDIENILNKTGIGKVITIPNPKASNLSNSDDIFSNFYGDIDADLMKATYETFKYDFQLFGYPVPQFIEENLRSY